METINMMIQTTKNHLLAQSTKLDDLRGRNLTDNTYTSSLFPIIYLGSILSRTQEFESSELINRLARYILNARSASGYWNYGGVSIVQNNKRYPDDLDDSALAISTIFRSGILSDDATSISILECFAKALKIARHPDNGLFNTWIIPNNIPDSHWDDIDIVVQSHILLCLSDLKISCPTIVAFIDDCIKHERFESKYYDSDIGIIYSIVSSYQGNTPDSLLMHVEKRAQRLLEETGVINILDAARLLSCLILLGSTETLITDMYTIIENNRHRWADAYPLYIELIENNIVHHVGSPTITLACIVQSLELYRKRLRASHTLNSSRQSLAIHLKHACSQILQSPYIYSEQMRECVRAEIMDILSKDGIQSLLSLPLDIEARLINGTKIPHSAVQHAIILGIAGWTTWMLMDKWSDSHGTKQCQIPLTSVLASIFHKALHRDRKDDRFLDNAALIIGTMEHANLDEISDLISTPTTQTKRTKRSQMTLLERMSAKSLGALLPTLYTLSSAEVGDHNIMHFEKFLTYLLLARQLSDDALDWEDDLATGRRTLVTEWITHKMKNYADADISNIFNDEIRPIIAKELIRYAQKGERSVRQTTCFTDVTFFIKMFNPYRRTAQKILARNLCTEIFDKTFPFKTSY